MTYFDPMAKILKEEPKNVGKTPKDYPVAKVPSPETFGIYPKGDNKDNNPLDTYKK